jgi:hypothetical protein
VPETVKAGMGVTVGVQVIVEVLLLVGVDVAEAVFVGVPGTVEKAVVPKSVIDRAMNPKRIILKMIALSLIFFTTFHPTRFCFQK